MKFAQIYREERLISRRSRARKARLAGRIIGFGLMIGFAAVLRSDPQLQAVVADIALKAIGTDTQQDVADPQAQAIADLGYVAGSGEDEVPDQLGLNAQPDFSTLVVARLPQSRVKINRPALD
ncbi:hypothetical protein [uncultured Sulfitobacter sp.]|uniref:hypothetical protein n=1 Tax=uncultured Sulfitobacter sp. TaxID=191468 RepID=UPI00260AD7F8|nr:hypothetical protein [uncultured Sulfitobacter sp.]